MLHGGARRSQYSVVSEVIFLRKVFSKKRWRMQSSILSNLVKKNLFMPAIATQLS